MSSWRSAAALLTAVTVLLVALPSEAARIWAAGEGARVRRDDVGSPLSRGEGNWAWRPGQPIRLAALRGEVVAFQVIVEAGDAPLEGVAIEVGPLAHERGEPSRLWIDRFVQHHVELRARSRNEQTPAESLGWTPGARPPDQEVLGWVPDALIPIDAAPLPDKAGRALPWPLTIAPRQNGAIWVDITVPEDAAPGAYTGEVRVVAAAGAELGRLDLRLTVAGALLPYRPVSFFAFYDAYQMSSRLGDATPEGATASERQLWQLLHRHHIDALTSLRKPEEIARIREALDGSLFTPAHGYRGPGQGAPPEVVALGAYGGLGDPTPEALRRVEELSALIPPAVRDVFVYAIDEQCDSPRGPTWRRLLRDSKLAGRVRAGHTCYRDPSRQDVDLVLVPAQRFDARTARAARAQGTDVWVYNGSLPRAGTFMIDAPPTALIANGWIAAAYPVGRWFLWEVGFWDDGNRGGRGPIDPFAQPENFHNSDGDACLGDGLLVYPGTQVGPFAAGSLGLPGVLPSMRLKALRRGIQDAGYVALARAAHPEAADALLGRAIPAALHEADEARPPTWSSDGALFAAMREALRWLIPEGATLDPEAARRTLAEAAEARAAFRAASAGAAPHGAGSPAQDMGAKLRRALPVGAAAMLVLLLAAGAAYQVRRARRKA